MLEKNKTALCEFIISIENNVKIIIDNWMDIQNVKSALKDRKISINKFHDNYALSILEYFIAVIKNEKEQGDCPIMAKLVNYLLTKGITPKEVFDICMGLRKSFIQFILNNEQSNKRITLYLDDISTIFDTNLSGVLDIFTNVYAESQKKSQIAKYEKNKLQNLLRIINSIDSKLLVVQDGRIILANKPLLNLLGIEDLKDLYKKYKKGFCFLNDIDIYEEDFKNNISLWIEKLTLNSQSFQANIYDKTKKQTLHFLGRITILSSDTTQYIIILNDITNEIQNEQLLKDRVTHDELTGFRNYPTFERLLIKKKQNTKKINKRIFLAVVDIDNLKEINNTNTIEENDLVIAEVAEDLRYFADENLYFARLEGNRFGILFEYFSEQFCYDWCVKLLHKSNQKNERKTIAITEIDLTESINKLLQRVYNMLEDNNFKDIRVKNDFSNIIEYKELSDQIKFIKKILKLSILKTNIFYKELAISHESKIIGNTDKTITVVLSKKQMKIVTINMPIYFKLSNIGSIKANISNINKIDNTVKINDFRSDKHTPLNRQKYRIAVSKNIKAYISYNDRDFNVELLDMNNECVAIKIDRKRNFDINSLIYLDMLLPISDSLKSCCTNATIIRINKIKNAYKMVLLCHFDSENKEILNKYIAKHQMEIIHKFKDLDY